MQNDPPNRQPVGLIPSLVQSRLLDVAPIRLEEPDAWLGHTPFAMWLVEALEPSRIVELGTHTGNSFSAFCQAIKMLSLRTDAFAVDTWEGDPHAGFYGSDVHDGLKVHIRESEYRFATMLRRRFDEALSDFEDGSIDILHIDGNHTYGAVRDDWDSWLPKVAPGGVVLLHDTHERIADFGVWRLWEELRESHPSFEFGHSHGLGVLAPVGLPNKPAVADLLTLEPACDAARFTQAIFAALGERVRGRLAARLDSEATSSRDQLIRTRTAEIEERDQVIRTRTAEVEERDQVIRTRTAEVEERDQVIRTRTAEVEERDQIIRTVRQRGHDRERTIADLEATNANLRQHLTAIELQRSHLERHAGSLSAQVQILGDFKDAVERSRGWRTIRFLRSPVRVLRQRRLDTGAGATPLLPLPERGAPEAVGRRVPSQMTPRSHPPLPVPPRSVDLIVPVFNRPDQVRNLFSSIYRSSDLDGIARIIIVDDSSDTRTAALLSQLEAERDAIRLITNETNQGYLRSCNSAFECSEAPYVVLLNTDVVLTASWMARLLDPLQRDLDVALVTPLATDGANLTLLPSPGSDWRDTDRLLETYAPNHPDACTAVGYVMAVRRSAVAGELYDLQYLDGYGEDSDLHYRITTSGYRSVIADDLVVHHVGRQSYSIKKDNHQIQQANRDIFFDKWGDVHTPAAEAWEQQAPLACLRGSDYLASFADAEPVDVLIVSPTDNVRQGGVKVIFDLASELSAAGLRTAVTLIQSDPEGPYPSTGITPIGLADLGTAVSGAKLVLATGVGTIEVARSLRQTYGSMLALLAQGPEMYFETGQHYERFRDICREVDIVVAVSEYLGNVTRDLGASRVACVPLGPDESIFYPRDLARRERTVAAAGMPNPDKGFRFALPILGELRDRGWRIELFGTGESELLDGAEVTRHGFLGAPELAALYSGVEFLLDMSSFEGLGMVPLEAAFCGAVPVMTHKGAPETHFTNGRDAVFIDDPFDFVGVADQMEIEREHLDALRGGVGLLAASRNKSLGISAAVDEIAKILGDRS